MDYWKLQHQTNINTPQKKRKRDEEIVDSAKKFKNEQLQVQIEHSNVQIQINEYQRTKDCNFQQQKAKIQQENMIEQTFVNTRFTKSNEVLRQLHEEKMNRNFKNLAL